MNHPNLLANFFPKAEFGQFEGNMTEKHINYKAKKLIFDGSEDQFYLFKEETYLTDTNEQVIYQNSVAKPIWEADDELKTNITKNINWIKKIEYKFDPTPSYKHDNLDIYFQKVSSEKTGREIIIVTAAGEAQPARYKIKLLGLIYK